MLVNDSSCFFFYCGRMLLNCARLPWIAIQMMSVLVCWLLLQLNSELKAVAPTTRPVLSFLNASAAVTIIRNIIIIDAVYRIPKNK